MQQKMTRLSEDTKHLCSKADNKSSCSKRQKSSKKPKEPLWFMYLEPNCLII